MERVAKVQVADAITCVSLLLSDNADAFDGSRFGCLVVCTSWLLLSFSAAKRTGGLVENLPSYQLECHLGILCARVAHGCSRILNNLAEMARCQLAQRKLERWALRVLEEKRRVDNDRVHETQSSKIVL